MRCIIHIITAVLLIFCGTCSAIAPADEQEIVYFVEKENTRLKNYVGHLQNFLMNKPIQVVNKIYLKKVKDRYTLNMNFDESVRFNPRIHTMPGRIKILLSFSKPIIVPDLKNFKHRLIRELSLQKIGNASLLMDLSFIDNAKILSKKYTAHGIKIEFQLILRKRIILDAGHGGNDPGTVGLHGEQEKDITLKFAKELRDLLNSTGKYLVIMVREDDKSYPVEDRVAKIMKINADMLISIHTDSNPVSQLHGMSVYTLPEILKGRDTTPAYMQNLHKSRDLAQRIISFIPNRCKIEKSPSRSSEMKILKISIPGVLIELGCLSNKIDSELLRMKEFRDKMNYAILYALDAYFEQRGK